MKEILMNLVNGLGTNTLNLIAIAVSGFIAKGVSVFLVKGYKYLLKKKMARHIAEFIPQGIAFGNILKGKKPNSERLFQAVLRVQNLTLKVFPERLRPAIDKLFDEKAIAREIERALNEEKVQGLENSTAE